MDTTQDIKQSTQSPLANAWAELQAHALEMRANPGMVHAEPNQLYLQPGQQGELVWHFTTAGKVDIACTIPGHLEAGMVGAINVAP